MLQVSPLGTVLSHQVPASLHDPNHTPGSARSHQESYSQSDAHAPDARWGPPKFPSATVTQTACWSTRPVPPSHANPAWRKRAWIAIRRHRASHQPHVAEVHVDSSVGEPLVIPVPIRAGLSKRWWTRTCVENGVLFPVRKRTLQQGIYNIKSKYKELIHFKIHIFHYLIRIFPRYNQHNSMSISCELMPWHQLWQQLIRRYQLTTVAEKYINQTTTVNL